MRTAADVIFADELDRDAELTFTREPPQHWGGHVGRIDAELIAGSGIAGGLAFVCGTNGFVESASALLLGAGFHPGSIRTERLGPTTA